MLRAILCSSTSPNKYQNQSSLKDKKCLCLPFYGSSPAWGFTRVVCFGLVWFFFLLLFPFWFSLFLLSTFSFSQEMESAQSRLSELELNCHINLLKYSFASFHITMMTASHHSKEPTHSSCSRSPCLNMLGIDGCFFLTLLQFEPTWSSLMELKSWHHFSDPPCFLLTRC